MTDNGKYIILSDGTPEGFNIPRQLIKINGEPLIKRTIRLLKENGIKDIIITSHDSRFDDLGVTRYEPLYNDWDYINHTGYWLSAFPVELLNEPVTFLFGDVYYSENAIKTIVQSKTDSILFLCSYKNSDKRYIKHHDEPFAFKVVDYVMFKEHIERVKTLKDEGKCCREPITWELYRSINNQDINTHEMTKNFIAINDESCDIDTINDIILLQEKLGGKRMIKLQALESFTLERFDELENIERAGRNEQGKLNKDDKFECKKDLADYLLGDNPLNRPVVKVIEIVPEIKEEKKEKNDETKIEYSNEKKETKAINKKNNKKKKTSKK